MQHCWLGFGLNYGEMGLTAFNNDDDATLAGKAMMSPFSHYLMLYTGRYLTLSSEVE